MINTRNIHLTFLFSGILLLTTLQSCQQQPSVEQLVADGQRLTQKAKELHSRHCLLQHQADSIWANLAEAMDKGIPKDFAPTDRSIFMNSRSLDHITMFKSFKMLDTSLRQLAYQTGEADKAIADQIRKTNEELSHFETEKMHLLMQLEHKDASKAIQFRNAIMKEMETPCPSKH